MLKNIKSKYLDIWAKAVTVQLETYLIVTFPCRTMSDYMRIFTFRESHETLADAWPSDRRTQKVSILVNKSACNGWPHK